VFGFNLANAIIAIRGDTAPLDASLQSLGYSFDKFAERASLGVGPLSLALKTMGGTLLGTAAALGATVKIAGDLESRYATLARVTGMSSDNLGKLRANLEAIARTTPGASHESMVGLANFAARLGVGGNNPQSQISDITELAQSLSKLSLVMDDMPVEDAATSIVRVLKTFGQGVGQAKAFASALVALDNASTATASELLAMSSRLAGAFSTLKASPTSVMALAAAMRDASVEAEAGSTAVSQLVMKMSQDTQKFADAIELTGESASRFAKTLKADPVEETRIWLTMLKTFAPEEQIKKLASLHMQGRLSGQILLKLASGMGDLGKFTNLAASEWANMTAVEEGAAIQGATTWKQMELLGQRLGLIGAEIGKSVLPLFKGLVGVMNEASNQALSFVQTSAPAWQKWAEGVGEKMKIVRAVFMDFGAATRIGRSYLEEFASNGLRIMGNFADSLFQMFQELTASIGKMMQNLFAEVVVKGVPKAAYGVAGSVGSWATSFFSKDIAKSIQYGAMLKGGETKIDLSKIMAGVKAPSFKGFDRESLLAGVVDRSKEREKDLQRLNQIQAGNGLIDMFAANRAAMLRVATPLFGAALQVAGVAKIPVAPKLPGRGTRARMLARQRENRLARLRKAAERRRLVRGLPAKPLVEVPGKVDVGGGEAAGDAGRTTDLMGFARSLQEAVFGGKKEDKLVSSVDENSDLTDKNNDALANTNVQLGKLVDQGLKVVFR
jgi:TP901 family phage tail tape measure protein